MSDVRDGLIAELCRWSGYWSAEGLAELADAILERFDVTPKPVISPAELGALVKRAELCCGPGTNEVSGERMLRELARAGLTIVRKEAGER